VDRYAEALPISKRCGGRTRGKRNVDARYGPSQRGVVPHAVSVALKRHSHTTGRRSQWSRRSTFPWITHALMALAAAKSGERPVRGSGSRQKHWPCCVGVFRGLILLKPPGERAATVGGHVFRRIRRSAVPGSHQPRTVLWRRPRQPSYAALHFERGKCPMSACVSRNVERRDHWSVSP